MQLARPSSRVLAVVVCVLGAGCASETAGETVARPTTTAAERDTQAEPQTTVPSNLALTRVDVGGYRLAIRCSGRGTPTVILEAGFGLSSSRWRRVHERAPKTPRICAYDRAGVGKSDDRPADARERTTAEELHALLTNGGIEPPYVLVGHSIGGIHVRVYDAEYPDEVAGLILVDAVHHAAIPTAGFGQEGGSLIDLGRIAEALAERASLGDMPLAVLERGIQRTESSITAQRDLARLSDSSVHVVALRSGHHIQAAQPEVVLAAIRAIVRSARRGAPLPPCEQAFAGLEVMCPSR